MRSGIFLAISIAAALALSSCASGAGREGGAEPLPAPAAPSGPAVPDDYLVTEAVGEGSFTLSWRPASSGGEGPSYRLFLSREPNIGSAQEAMRKGRPVGEWGSALEASAEGLPPGSFWYANVVAWAPDGGATAYRMKRIRASGGAVYAEKVPVLAQPSALPEGWWKGAVFYECQVRVFQDSNGDGIGDLRGLTSRLDYLKSLGVGGLWLLPVDASSDKDHGYHVTDYFSVEPEYGTEADLSFLIAEAHRRGMGVILDFVVNHSSVKHPFFQECLADGDRAAYRPWYCWEDEKPGVWSIPEDQADAWHPAAGGWYFGGIAAEIPDWNFRNPSVRAYLEDSVRHWLNLGIDGYRYDAVANLYEEGPFRTKSLPQTFAYFERLRSIVNQYPNRFLVCENGDPRYLGSGDDEFNAAFAFEFLYRAREALRSGWPQGLREVTARSVTRTPGNARYATLLGNHDGFTGERIGTFLGGDLGKEKLAAAVLLLSPGIPFLYQGEEIGLSSANAYPGDYALRTPMQWDASANAGFTTGKPIRQANADYRSCNAEAEGRDPGSLLSRYRALGALRASCPELRDGAWKALPASDPRIYAFLRSAGTGRIAVALNFSGIEKSFSLDLSGQAGSPGTDLLEPALVHPELDAGNAAAYPLTLPPYGVAVFRLSK